MDTRYRIYTEDVKYPAIRRKVSEHFDAFTVYHATGVWKNTPESSLVIEILGTFKDDSQVRLIAKWIKLACNQEAVLVTRETIGAELI